MSTRLTRACRSSIPAMLAGIAALATAAGAAERTWLLPEGGTFNVAGNWDPLGVPVAGDTAIFTITETFTVDFSASVVNELLNVEEGEVTFELQSLFAYDANGLVVGNGTGKVGELTVLNGTIGITPIEPPLEVRIGKDIGADGNLEIASGGGLNSSDTVIVGDGGIGRLRASSGGIVQTERVIFADDAGASGTGIVVGGGASWTASDTMTIGNLGDATMSVRLGGTLVTNGSFAADDIGSSATVDVDGKGSTWTDQGTVNFGNAADADLSIVAGGIVTWDGISRLADDIGATGDVTIDGAGSQLNVGGELFVGNQGAASITASNGAALDTTRVKLGDETGALGTVTLQTASTWVDAVDIFVGNFGTGVLDVSGASTVTGVTGTLGDDPGSNGTAVIDGVGSSWTSTSSLRIGDLGTGSLTVRNGGAASATSVMLGVQPGGAGTAVVDGLGSTFTASGPLQVGVGGSGLLRVVDGGHVDAQGGYTQAGDLEIVLGPDSANMISVTGTATLGGALDVSLAGGFAPGTGETFVILQAGLLSGTFGSVSAASGLDVTIEPTRVVVTVTGSPCPADIDGDGNVGFGDILRILGAWGPCGVCAEDLDGDGNVGFGDILIVLSSWGPCP